MESQTQETIDERYLKMALQLAAEAGQKGEIPVGAIVVWGGKIIGRGHNMTEALNDPTAHAEMLAVGAACNHLSAKYLTDATIYISLEPCLMCCGALYWSKIGRIVFAASDVKNGYRKVVGDAWPFHPKTKLSCGTMATEAALLMKNFFALKR